MGMVPPRKPLLGYLVELSSTPSMCLILQIWTVEIDKENVIPRYHAHFSPLFSFHSQTFIFRAHGGQTINFYLIALK